MTFRERYVEPEQPTVVSQAFCSALSCGYSGVALDHWQPLVTLVLDAAYEATLLAASLRRTPAGAPPRRGWLTLLGGGAFGSRKAWIGNAIGRAVSRTQGHGLEIRVAHYRRIDQEIVDAVEAGLNAN